jgi:chemotaxis family two-component system sensor kinase Cph1
MTEEKISSDKFADLRQQAEEVLQRQPEELREMPSEDIQHLIHELEVHQVELELQNEELRRTQRELELSRDRYLDLYDFAPVGYFTVSETRLILEANLTAATMLGVKRGRLIKQPLTRFIGEEDQDVYYLHRKQLFETREPQVCELRMVRKDGSRFWARIEATVALDSKGRAVCRATMSDITAWVRAEEALKQTMAELEASRTAALNMMADANEARRMAEGANKDLKREIVERVRAEEKLKQNMADLERSNKELEQFAYVASHDLQEPLRMVSSYTQLLARRYQGQLDADADDFIAYAVDGANRMQRLINDLLAYSRVGTRGKPFEPTDCNSVLGQARVNLSAAIEESSALVTNDELPTVMADEAQLVQLFQNLIGNAIKFRSEKPPYVHVSAQRIKDSEIPNPKSEVRNPKSESWVFSVRDNGIGIDPQYHERIFVIFQRLHKKEEYPGTGVGLAICKRIVERHGGKIWVESGPGEGSTFYFTIPMREGGKHDRAKDW